MELAPKVLFTFVKSKNSPEPRSSNPGPRNPEPGTRPKRAIFFDRDGVINARIVGGYVRHWSEFELLPDVVETLREVKRRGYLAIIVTNQRGVGHTSYPFGHSSPPATIRNCMKKSRSRSAWLILPWIIGSKSKSSV